VVNYKTADGVNKTKNKKRLVSVEWRQSLVTKKMDTFRGLLLWFASCLLLSCIQPGKRKRLFGIVWFGEQ